MVLVVALQVFYVAFSIGRYKEYERIWGKLERTKYEVVLYDRVWEDGNWVLISAGEKYFKSIENAKVVEVDIQGSYVVRKRENKRSLFDVMMNGMSYNVDDYYKTTLYKGVKKWSQKNITITKQSW